MQTWECMVRMPSNHIQNVIVEAYSYNDAVTMAESSTSGKCLNATAKWQSPFEDEDNTNTSSSSGDGYVGVALFFFVLAFLFYAWKWLLLFAGLSFGVWMFLKAFEE